MLKLPSSYGQWLSMVKNGAMAPGKFSELVVSHLLQAIKNHILDVLSDILPVALTVAAATLLVTLGWKLFRNFTRG